MLPPFHAFRQASYVTDRALARKVVDRDAADLQVEAGARPDVAAVVVDLLHEGRAHVAATEHTQADHSGRHLATVPGAL
jgi:hypothetical protein